MAKILFSLASNINWLGNTDLDPFYEGLLRALINEGNEVRVIRTNDFLNKIDSNNLMRHINENYLKREVLKFDPDVVIAANNHIPRIILDFLECPILLWSADGPNWYSDHSYIKKNISRYKFFHHGYNNFQSKICQEIFGAKESQNYSIGYATSVRAKDNVPIKNNITFIGTVGWPDNTVNYLKYKCKTNEELSLFHSFYLKQLNLPLSNLEDNFNSTLKLNDFLHTITSNNRIKTLDNLVDLGLKVYGYSVNFFSVAPYSMELAFCFDYTPVKSIATTEEILNASKIGINLYNAQAVKGFSWRVADIMASNACLVSPCKEDSAAFSPYIKIPSFNSPAEARELCQALLKDDARRRDIIEASHKAIEEHGRFEHMLKSVGEIIGLNLLSNEVKSKTNDLTYLKFENFIKPAYTPLFVLQRKIQKSNFIRNIILVILKIIPKSILKNLYYFLLSLKDHVNK